MKLPYRWLMAFAFIVCAIGYTTGIEGEDFDGMIYITAGDFVMGTDSEEANEDQRPAHTVYLDAYSN